jgi:hypothetical protein
MRFVLEDHSHRLGKTRWPLAIVAAVFLMGAPAQAVSINETVSGDLSNDADNPTNIGSLTLGNNSIVGSTIPSGPIVDQMTGARAVQDNDYVSFSVSNGEVLSQIFLGSDSVFVPGDRMFFGIAQGDQVTVDPSFTSASGLLGWTLVGSSMAGSDVLPLLGASAPANFPAIPGATGFSGSLSAGIYTIWLLDGDQPASYDLDLVATPAPAQVPEAASWMVLLAGLGLMAAILRRRPRRERQNVAMIAGTAPYQSPIVRLACRLIEHASDACEEASASRASSGQQS